MRKIKIILCLTVLIILTLIFVNKVFSLTGPHSRYSFGCAECHNVHEGVQGKRLWYDDKAVARSQTVVEALCRWCHYNNSNKTNIDGQVPSGFDNVNDPGAVHTPGHLYMKKNHRSKDYDTLFGFESTYRYRQFVAAVDEGGGSMVSCYVCHNPHGSQYVDTTYVTRDEANSLHGDKALSDNYFVTNIWRSGAGGNDYSFRSFKNRWRNGKVDPSKVIEGITYREYAYESTETPPSYNGDTTVNIRDLCFNCHRPEVSNLNIWFTDPADSTTKSEENDDSTITSPKTGERDISPGMQYGDTTIEFDAFCSNTKMRGPIDDGFDTFDLEPNNPLYDRTNKICVVGCHNPKVGETGVDTRYNTARWDVVDTTWIKGQSGTWNQAYKTAYGSTYVYYSKIACIACHNTHGKLFDDATYSSHHPYDVNFPTTMSLAQMSDTSLQRRSRAMCLSCHEEHIKYQNPIPRGGGITLRAEVLAHRDDTTLGIRKELCIYCHSWRLPLIPGDTVCNSCHGFPPKYNDSKRDVPGVHETHVFGEGYSCKTCHGPLEHHNENEIKKPEDYKDIDRSKITISFQPTIVRTVAKFGKPFETTRSELLRYNRRRGTHSFGYKIFGDVDYSDKMPPETRPFKPESLYYSTEVPLTLICPTGNLASLGTYMCLSCHDNEVKGVAGYKNDALPLLSSPLMLPYNVESVYRKPLPIVNIGKYYFLSGHGTSYTATKKKPVKDQAHKPGVTMTDCADCHEAHGSRVFPLIKEYITDAHDTTEITKIYVDGTVVSDNNICYACHKNKLENGFWPGMVKYETSIHYRYWQGATPVSRVFDADTTKSWVSDLSSFVGPPNGPRYNNRFRHDSSLTTNGSGASSLGAGRCVNCHNPHGDGSVTTNKPTWPVMDSSYKNMLNYPGSKLCYRCHANPSPDKHANKVARLVGIKWEDYNITSWIDSDIQRQFESTIEPTAATPPPAFKGSHHDVGGISYQDVTKLFDSNANWVIRGDWGGLKVNKLGYDTTVYDWMGYSQTINNLASDASSGDDSRLECINCHNPHIVQRDDQYGPTPDVIETLINPDPDNGAPGHGNSYNARSPFVKETKFDTFFTLIGTVKNKWQGLNRFCLRCHDHDTDVNVTGYNYATTYLNLDPPGWLYKYDTLMRNYETDALRRDFYKHQDGISDTTSPFFGELPRGVLFPKTERGNQVWQKWDKVPFYYKSGHGKYEDLKVNYDTTISCMDCHQPHGSGIQGLLRTDTTGFAVVPTGGPSISMPEPTDNGETFCYRCHEFPLNNGFWNGKAGWNYNASYSIPAQSYFSTYQKGYESSIHSIYPYLNGRAAPVYNSTKGYFVFDAGKCVNCHDPHGAGEGRGTYYGTMGFPNMTHGYKEKLCYQCHNSKAATWPIPGMDIESDFGGTNVNRSRHDIDTTSQKGGDKFWDTTLDYILGGTGLQDDDRRIECISCHNVHVVSGKYVEGNTYTPVTDPGNPVVPMFDNDLKISYRNGRALNAFCIKCHDAGGWDTSNIRQIADTRYKSSKVLFDNHEYIPRPVIFPNRNTLQNNRYENGGDKPLEITYWYASNKRDYGRYYNKEMFYYTNGHGADSTTSVIGPREPINELCIGCHDPHGSSNIKLVRDKVTPRFRLGGLGYQQGNGSLRINMLTNYQQMDTLSTIYDSVAGRGKDRFCNWACHKIEFKPKFTYVRDNAGRFVYPDPPDYTDSTNPLIDSTYDFYYGNGGIGGDIGRRDPDLELVHASDDYLPGAIGYQSYLQQKGHSDMPYMKFTYYPATDTYLGVDSTIPKIKPPTAFPMIYYQRYTCMTCHNPHGTSDSGSDKWASDEPGVIDSTWDEGMLIYEPENSELCKQCHIYTRDK